jgi:hypothetical protein
LDDGATVMEMEWQGKKWKWTMEKEFK